MDRARVINLHDEPLGDAVYVGRASPRKGLKRSPFANPFQVGCDGSRTEVLAKFRQYLRDRPELVEQIRRDLRKKRLACWCVPKPCHAQVVAAVADGEEP